jgi:hypothetical protein
MWKKNKEEEIRSEHYLLYFEIFKKKISTHRQYLS